MHEPEVVYEVPMMSLAERARRWNAVRERMAEEGLDCLLAHAGGGSLSALYLTQIDMDGLAVFPAEGEPTFLLPTDRWLHWAQRSQQWVRDVRAVRDPAATAGQLLDEAGARRVGVVDAKGMAAGAHQALMNAVSDYETTDASSLVYGFRLIKSDEEIAMMQRAAEIADTAIDTLLATARVGVSEHEVYAEMYRQLLAGGCEPTSGLSTEASARPFHPVRRPSMHELREGDAVIAHINPRYSGYFGHPHVCVTVGEPSPQIRQHFPG
jgi:Xaa-Pro aminopeptidase